MAQSQYDKWLGELNLWLKDIKNHEVKDLIRQFSQAEETLSQYTKQQIADYRYYLQRDFEHWQQHQAHYNALAISEFKESIWLQLFHLVDKSQIEWHLLMGDFDHNGVYQQGEWVGFGEMICKKCHNVHSIMHPQKLSECEHCQGVTFTRRPYTP